MIANHLSVLLRPAARSDAAAIRSVDGLGAPTLALLERDLDDPDHLVLLALARPQVVGVALGMLMVDQLHVTDIAVSSDHRRSGIGSQLLEGLVAAGAARGATAATLEVRPSNAAARALYRQAGFVEDGRRPGYYPPSADGTPREDALILWRHDVRGLAHPLDGGR